MTVGMMLSAKAGSVEALWALRFCTGLGVGGMAGCVGTLTFEYCPLKTRALGAGGWWSSAIRSGHLLGGYAAPPAARAIQLAWNIRVWRSLLSAAAVIGVFPVAGILGHSGRPQRAQGHWLPSTRSWCVCICPLWPNCLLPRWKRGQGKSAGSAASTHRGAYRAHGTHIPAVHDVREYFFLNWNNQLTTDAGFSDSDGIFITRLTSLGGLGWRNNRRAPWGSIADTHGRRAGTSRDGGSVWWRLAPRGAICLWHKRVRPSSALEYSALRLPSTPPEPSRSPPVCVRRAWA